MPKEQKQAENRTPSWKIALTIVAWVVTVGVAFPTAAAGFYGGDLTKSGLAAWIFGEGIDQKSAYFFWLDCSIPLFALCFIPVMFLFPVPARKNTPTQKSTKKSKNSKQQPKPAFDATACWLSLVVAICSLFASYHVSQMKVGDKDRFGKLPPAYHDEFSYLLQAKTFAAGKLSYDSQEEVPRIFDQMHVVNETRFASRYFPGTGMWLAPFLAMEIPYFGQWLAGAISAVLFFWIGRELNGNLTGLIAGVLTAISPGMALFSNLLLSHHATMLGLSVFLFCFLKWNKKGSRNAAILAGAGLSFAMLCRPMTAFGFGLPFGFWFISKLCRTDSDDGKRRWQIQNVLAMGTPILIGFLVMFAHNRAITGDGFLAPYKVFNETYTPRHVYGFQNARKAENPTDPAFVYYDDWAENLDTSLAMKNLRYRWVSSWQWTLGFLPLLLGFLLLPLLFVGGDRRWWPILFAVISLHLVHFPYWYDGIMHWHYVFETGPLLLLLLAGVSMKLKEVCSAINRWLFAGWILFLLASVVPNYWSMGKGDPLWSASKMEWGVMETSMSRLQFQSFQKKAKNLTGKNRILILIAHDPTVPHIDFVTNDPEWDSQIIYGRYRPDLYSDEEILKTFPNRKCYLYDAKTKRVRQLGPGAKR